MACQRTLSCILDLCKKSKLYIFSECCYIFIYSFCVDLLGGQWYILAVTYRSLTFKNYTLWIDAEVIKGKQTCYTNCMIIKRIMCYIRLITLTLSMLSMSSVIVLTLNKTKHNIVTSYELNKAWGNVQSMQNVKSVQFSQVWCERDL